MPITSVPQGLWLPPVPMVLPFVWSNQLGNDGGWLVDAAAEKAGTFFNLPPGTPPIVSIEICAVSVVLEADRMRLEIHVYAGAENESWSNHTVGVQYKPSETSNFAALDMIWWKIISGEGGPSDITDIQGGDCVALKVTHEAAGNGDCATNAYFQSIRINFV